MTGSGTCGENLTWTFNEATGTLTISGTGDMRNYKPTTAMPWAEYLSEITSVVIEEGITSIGDYAFYDCNYINKIKITHFNHQEV